MDKCFDNCSLLHITLVRVLDLEVIFDLSPCQPAFTLPEVFIMGADQHKKHFCVELYLPFVPSPFSSNELQSLN